jgi:hypothetical protein
VTSRQLWVPNSTRGANGKRSAISWHRCVAYFVPFTDIAYAKHQPGTHSMTNGWIRRTVQLRCERVKNKCHMMVLRWRAVRTLFFNSRNYTYRARQVRCGTAQFKSSRSKGSQAHNASIRCMIWYLCSNHTFFVCVQWMAGQISLKSFSASPPKRFLYMYIECKKVSF